MSKLDYMYIDGCRPIKTSCDHIIEAKDANKKIADMYKIKTAEEFEAEVKKGSVKFWYVYRIDNTKRFVDPFEKE